MEYHVLHPQLRGQAIGVKPRVFVTQEFGFQDVSTAPVWKEEALVQVHLAAWRLEVQCHCGQDGAEDLGEQRESDQKINGNKRPN